MGQVTSGKKHFSDNTPVAGEQFTYGFDDTGNRTATGAGGDQAGANLRSASYYPNLLNQNTNRTVPNKVDVIGDVASTSLVTVNMQTGYRKGSFFRNEVPVANSNAAVWLSITNKGSLVTGGSTKIASTNLGNIFVPQSPEASTYDADGNLTSDGRWTNTWNGAGQLISMVSLTTGPTGSKKQLDFLYDYMGRRIQKIVYAYSGGTYVAQSTNRFLYDGWNLIAELDETNAKVRNYLWGSDLSGKMQGAGGIGGLLAMKNATDTHFVAFDGNGNVTTLVKASNGANAASYEYGPFGELFRLSESVLNPIRFSTKYQDEETELLYYGYRYFNANLGRWLSRDPAPEEWFSNPGTGAVAYKKLLESRLIDLSPNLYVFVGNNPLNKHDFLGLFDQVIITDNTQKGDVFMWMLQSGNCAPIFNIHNWEDLIKDLERIASWAGPLDTLNISGHGAAGGVKVEKAEDNLIVDNLSPSQARRLKNLFGPNGKVKFWGCHCATGGPAQRRLQELANALRVPVVGGVGLVTIGADGLFGWNAGTTSPTWIEFKPK